MPANRSAPSRTYRPSAPGVLQTIDPMPRMPKDMPWDHEIVSTPSAEDTVSPHSIVELLAADPKFDWAKRRLVPARRLGPEIPVQADADDLGGRAAGDRPDAAETDLVHGLFGDQPRKGDAPGRDRRFALRHVAQKTGFEIREEDRPVRFIPGFCSKAISGWTRTRASRRSTTTASFRWPWTRSGCGKTPTGGFLHRRKCARDPRGQDRLGGSHLAGRRPAGCLVLGLRLGLDERLPLERRARRI